MNWWNKWPSPPPKQNPCVSLLFTLSQLYLSPCLTCEDYEDFGGGADFQSYLSPCLTLLRHRYASLRCLYFQSYLNPCLTVSAPVPKDVLTINFQSYLSPCLTFITSSLTSMPIIFQSYLSPCLTRFPYSSTSYSPPAFNPTLVRV